MRSSNFEVQVSSDGRWIISNLFTDKAEALKNAQALLKTAKGDAVRVVEERGSGSTSTIFEEKIAGKREAELTISAVDETPLCEVPADFYRFPARRTAGRLFRSFLDKQGVTALEVLFDRTRLSELARMERLLNQGIQRIADLQSDAVGCKPGERIDVLWAAFNRIRERTRDADAKAGLAVLDQQGMHTMLAATAAEGMPEEADVRAFGVLAACIAREAEWMGKLERILDLLDKPCGKAGVSMLDGVMAEIVDGNAAARDLLGAQSNLGAALLCLSRLASGRGAKVRWPVQTAARLAETMGRLDLPETRAVLLARVTRNLSGLQPLSRDDEEADRAAFTALLESLIASAGLWGGAPMSEAIVRRLRMTFGVNGEDLTFEQAQKMLMKQFPSGLVRLGFLLDISATSLWERNQAVVLKELLTRIDGIRALSDLLPPGGGTAEFLTEAVHDLIRRFKASALPEEAGALFAAKMAQFLKEAEQAADLAPETFRAPVPEKKGLPRREYPAGHILFQEGDAGSDAYIIISGEIEIIRRDGNTDRVIAVLDRGAIFGEMALIDDQPRMATARVRKDAVLTLVPRNRFKAKLDRALESDHVVGLLIRTFVERLRLLPSGPGVQLPLD
ncbi:MAG: cyclic nucleotide-binding domain-containing protein [Alphaproteobacteria bacterium]|nr:cyclic nucleotide-binding domain-containing protein [Alphaproteobacteria bacterium]